jgi:hypothetical protein
VIRVNSQSGSKASPGCWSRTEVPSGSRPTSAATFCTADATVASPTRTTSGQLFAATYLPGDSDVTVLLDYEAASRACKASSSVRSPSAGEPQLVGRGGNGLDSSVLDRPARGACNLSARLCRACHRHRDRKRAAYVECRTPTGGATQPGVDRPTSPPPASARCSAPPTGPDPSAPEPLP